MSFLQSPWFGYSIIAYGLVTIVLRRIKPTLFRKLAPMQARFGHRAGTWVHIAFYSALPIAFGALVLKNNGVWPTGH